MKVVNILISIFITCFCFAQGNKNVAVFISNADKGDGILVKWLYNEVYNPAGFDLYRSSANNNWEKLNSSPIQLNKNANTNNFDKETKELFQVITQTPHEEFITNLARAFVMLKAIYNNQFASAIGIHYHDKTAIKGNTYQYKLTKANENSELAISSSIICGDYIGDFAPKEVNLDRKKKFIAINWKPDVYSYYGVDIYRKELEGGDFLKLTKKGPIAIDINTQKKFKASDVFFVDTLIDNDKGYVYKFASINYLGQVSDFSQEYIAAIKDFDPPASPYTFKVRPYSVEQFVRLTWEAIEEPDLNGFNVYSSRDPEGQFNKINNTLLSKDSRVFDTPNLPVGGHYFIVSAVDLAGNETTSGMMFGEIRDVEPPAAPTGLECKAESGKITLSWNPNSEGDLLGYIIQKSLSDSNNLDNKYVRLNDKVLKETSFEIVLPKNVKNEFVYRILAVDTLFNISKPSINSLAQMPDVTPPKSPVISSINTHNEIIQPVVKWIKNVDEDLAGYKLLRKSKDDSIFVQVNFSMIPSDVTEYIDRSAEKGISYEYVLKSIDFTGNESENSNRVSFALAKEKSESSVEIIKSLYNAKRKEIQFEWKWNGEENPKGYVGYMMSNDGILKPVTGLNQENNLKIKQTLEEKTKFEVRAYTLDGQIIKSKLFVIEATKN